MFQAVTRAEARASGASSLKDLSREELIELLEARSEGGIRIDFSGKDNARKIARRVRPRVARTIKKYSVGLEKDQALNCLIEGDNLQAMATLFRERGQVDFILTDPPYNTGNDWRYNDRWEDDPNDPGIGDWVGPEDGDRHTKWMRFMWPRLQMMRSMLKPSGVLAICIDHRELFHIGQMLDELFGERNRLAIINWQKSYTTRGDSGHIATTTEYVLAYSKKEDLANTRLLPRTDSINARYRNPDGDPRLWKSGHSGGPNPETHRTMVYGIQHPFTGEIIYPNERNCWRFGRTEMKRFLEEWGTAYVDKKLDDGLGEPGLVLKGSPKEAREKAEARLAKGSWPRLYFGKKGQGRPQIKFYLEDIKKGVIPTTYWADEDYDDPLELGSTSWDFEQSGYSQTGVRELTEIVGEGHNFTTVKPLKLFTKLTEIWCPPDGLVVDPFAGSGTTGHAVLSLNDETSSSRQFVLIEQGRPERGDPYASSLTADRLARVITGDWAKEAHPPLQGGFAFQRLDKRVDAQTLLKMERDEMVDTVIASHFDAESRRREALVKVRQDEGFDYLVAHNSDGEGFFLIWSGADGNTDFTEDTYTACAAEAKTAGLKARYHVYARLYLFQTGNVVFYQIPDRILTDFGLDLRGEPFHDDDS
jgi:adenine-specific DNA-methyltransferase